MERGVDSRRRILGDRYALERELGRGGMGTVWLARDLRHDRSVAVKFLGTGGPTGSADAARFLAEIRTAAQLQHPHILAVHDSGEADGSLYYVMPRIDGESLRGRVEREGRMPVHEAVRIAREIADALWHAHAQGIVHRDIKPENVLLDRQGHACVADFGLARALSTVRSTRLTTPGLTVGSPAYMSPEQIEGNDDVDGRSDLYALGCILYEMLTGRPPYEAARAADVMRRHLTDAIPSVRARRADVSPDLDAIVTRLLAKDPEARFASGHDVMRALGHVAAATDSRSTMPLPRAASPDLRVDRFGRRQAALAILSVLAVAATAFWVVNTDRVGVPGLGAETDSTHYAILPLRSSTTALASMPHHLMLREAFARWQELVAIDPMRTADAVARHAGAAGLSTEEAAAAARDLGAGRFVHGSEATVGDSVELNLGLYDAEGDGRPLRVVSARTPAGGLAATDFYAALADSLLFGRATVATVSADAIGTRSMRARTAYGRAHVALETWQLGAADSLLATSVSADRGFTRAHLWLALVRSWLGQPASAWAAHADEAAADTLALTPRERLLAVGLSELGSGRFSAACDAFASVARADDRDFAGWFGLGECRARDNVVVADASSPTGYRFRSSYHAGVEAYRRAFDVLPSSHLTVRDGGIERLHNLFFTGSLKVRFGRSPNSSNPDFVAHPALAGDTLAFLPVPWERWTGEVSAAWRDATIRQRRIFADVAARWTGAYPQSVEAAYAQAAALDMLGDPAAVTWVRRARALEPAGQRWLDLAAAHVWIELRHGTPDTTSIARARSLADTLLAENTTPDSSSAGILAPLAMLTGRISRAAEMARLIPQPGVPAAVSGAAGALLAFATAGAPVDSIRHYERVTLDAIRNAVGEDERARVRGLLLEQPAMLAFPAVMLDWLGTDSMRMPQGAAQAALIARDSVAFRTAIDLLRPRERPADVSPESRFTTARLLAFSGDTAAAIHWLDDTLGALRWYPLDTFQKLSDAGVLGRAMALRPRLAMKAGDRATARRWGLAVATLWANADPALRNAARRLAVTPDRT